jgi:hypothetical protein
MSDVQKFLIRFDTRLYEPGGYRPSTTSFRVDTQPNEFVRSLGLLVWTSAGELLPLLSFPFTLDDENYIRFPPSDDLASSNCQCACCAARANCKDCCR